MEAILYPEAALEAMCYTRAMKRLRWVLVGLIVVLVGTGGMAAWAYAHRAYPNPVYYQEGITTVVGPNPLPTVRWEQWDDPRGKAQRAQQVQSGEGANCITIWHGAQSECDGHVLHPHMAQSQPRAWQDQVRQWQELQQGGFSAEGKAWLRRATGPIIHVLVSGRPALRVPVSGLQVYWLDAVTYVPLQWQQTLGIHGLWTVTDRFVHSERLAPGTLPADFFTRQGTHTSLWDQAREWVRQHVGLG